MDGEIRSLTFSSSILDTEFELFVYIPPNYHDGVAYHLAIAQDGQDYFKLGKIGRKIETLILDEAGPETIVVGVPYPRIAARRKWYHPDGEATGEYLQFLTEELLPYLGREFSLQEEADGRTLLGDSLAGSLALLACLKYPDTFTRAAMHSPYVNDTLLNTIDASAELERLTIYHTVGSKEEEVKGTDGSIMDFITMNENLHAKLVDKVSNYRYKIFENGDHTWRTWEPDLHKALHFMFIQHG
ncbi:enterochelin esterase family protein [Geomicrobium halophilum]|uniref:Enterochelin esterase family protein n=1 Tax=Geomicrobium halophilum TaxID=549000 RepID=A0A841PW54_9BACL|nr:alpha/beta hydrolase-fold protein [Geomicrobium halophilum]MBB6448503.1 enterochelin esterase family protein [Geomicrobium halophilum]